MKKIYLKNPIIFTTIISLLYLAFIYVCIDLFESLLICNIVLFIFLTIIFILIKFYKVSSKFGLNKLNVKEFKDIYYYIPLFLVLIISSSRLFLTENIKSNIILDLIFILLICVIEELIFRGFVFNVFKIKNKRINIAIVISTFSFIIDNIILMFLSFNKVTNHELIIELFEIVETLAIGFSLSLIFSLNNCIYDGILFHFILNSLKLYGQTTDLTLESIILITTLVIISVYNVLLYKKSKKIMALKSIIH